jgi:hypothetical protein
VDASSVAVPIARVTAEPAIAFVAERSRRAVVSPECWVPDAIVRVGLSNL